MLLILLAFRTNSAHAQIHGDEQLIFFPTIARQLDKGWELTVHGWVHEPEERRVLGSILRRAIGIDRDALNDAERDTYRQRTRYFLPDNERRKVITLQVGTLHRSSTPTAANGQFQLDWKLSQAQFAALSVSNRSIAVSALLATNDSRIFVGSVHVLSNRGLSVISDIDDTIKISEVRDHDALLRNTFCRPFKAAPGMAQLYRDWERLGAQFHYVSASPWQLYIPLAEFLGKAGFPAGTFHMKEFRVKDRSFLSLLADPQAYKLRIITPLLERFPDRQFVLVGDSGEKDPEIYGVLARRFPRQVAAILIRNVTSEKAASDRYKNAFPNLPNNRWIVFDHPNELPDIYLRLSLVP
jgi:phosphatidate phosphatase APP1